MQGFLIFNCVVDWERAADAHALLPINEQRVDFVLQVSFQARLRHQQVLMLRFGVLKLAMQSRDGILNFANFLNQPHVGVVATQLQVRSVTASFETSLSDFERIRLVVDRLPQHVDVLLDIENLLLSLVKVQLDFAFSFHDLGRPTVERVVGVAPAVPHGRGASVDQSFGVRSKLRRLRTFRLRAGRKKN